MTNSTAGLVSSQGFEYGVKHFLSPTDGFIADIIFNVLKLSESEIQVLFKLGSIYVNNQRLKSESFSIHTGDPIRVHTKPRRYDCNYDWKSLIVFQNSDFLILNKPAGLPSHPSVDNQIENSLTQTELSLGQKILISHRLDTTTEGLIVYGLNSSFVKSFNQQLQSLTMIKKYVALVEGTQLLPEKICHYMERSPRAPKKVFPHQIENSDFCELHVLNQKKIDSEISHVHLNLLTGRTHQIRAQLSELGHPIIGDSLYGSKMKWPTECEPNPLKPQIALRSQMIEFQYQGKLMNFELSLDF